MDNPVIINLFGLFPLLFTIYLAKRHLSGSRQNRYYILASALTIAELLLEIVCTVSRSYRSTTALTIHYLSYCLADTLIPSIPLVILLYLGFSELPRIRKFLLWLPQLANVILSILSIQTGWYFIIDSKNTYQRGPYFWIITAFALFYYLLILLRLIKLSRNRIIPAKPMIALVYLLPILSTTIQLIVHDEIYVFSSIAIALLLYYLIFQEARFDYDMQTEVRNREAFELEMASDRKTESETAVFMFDVNNLKQTNDTWGHHEGDALLFAVAKLLVQVFEPEGKVFRIGGDEFCAIVPMTKNRSPQWYSKTLALQLLSVNEHRVHPISLGCGFAVTNKGENCNLQKAFILADNAMYKDKRSKRKELSLFK